MRQKLLLLLLMALAFLPPTISARIFEYNGVKYTVIDEEAKTCKTTDEDIPDQHFNRSFRGVLELPAHPVNNGVEYTLIAIDDMSFLYSWCTSVKIPETVKEIGDRAFASNEALTSVELHNSLVEIKDHAFYDCPSLTTILYRTTQPLTTTNEIFSPSTYYHAKLYVEEGGKRGAESTHPWSQFITIEERNFDSNPPTAETVKTFTYQGNGYLVLDEENKLCELTSVANGSGDLVLPEKIPGAATSDALEGEYTLISIGKDLNQNSCSYSSVSIPNTVRWIGDGAFRGWQSLNSVKMPETLISIGDRAFYNCTCLSSVELSNSIRTIGEQAFAYCPIKEIVIPSSIESIGDNAFECCRLRKIYYDTLDPVNIPNKIFDETVLFSCDLVFAIGVPHIKDRLPWKNFNNYFGQDFASEPPVLSSEYKEFENDGIIYSVIDEEQATCEAVRVKEYHAFNSTTLTFPKYVTDPDAKKNYTLIAIAPDFNGYSDFQNIILPTTLRIIGSYAFSSFEGKSIEIPSGVVAIGDYAFSNSKLTTIDIPTSVRSIGDYAFEGCWSLTDVTIPLSITSIGAYTFYQCLALTSIDLPISVRSIGEGAFEGCSALTNVTLSSSLTEIKSNAFKYCSKLQKITLPSSLESIGESAFNSCRSLSSISLPSTLKTIGKKAFFSCNSLPSIVIPDAVANIEESAFGGCDQLAEVKIGSGVKTIGKSAFANCKSLSNVTMGNSVTSMEDRAFQNCSQLSSVKLSNAIRSIGNYAFYEATNLTSITLPETLQSIGNCAFYDAGLTSIKIPNTVTSVGDRAFAGCEELSNVEGGAGIIAIGASAFGSCGKLTSFTFPKTLRVIGSYAFSKSALENIDIPGSISGIDQGAFDNCKTIKNVEYYTLDPVTGTEDLFSDEVYQNATLTVAKGGLEAAKKTLPWSKFVNIEGVDCVEAIEIAEAPSLSMCIEKEKKLTLNVLPATYTGYTLNWTNSDPSVVTVDSEGNIQSLKAGVAVITVASDDKLGATKEITITVVEHSHGDANMSGEVSIADATHTANHAVGNEVNAICTRAADVNGDDKITIADASGIVKIVIEQPATAMAQATRSESQEMEADCDKLVIANISGYVGDLVDVEFGLDNSEDYVALQADIYLPAGLTVESVKLGNRASDFSLITKEVGDGIFRVVIYNFSNIAFENTADALFTLNLYVDAKVRDEIKVGHIVAADAKGNEYKLSSIGGRIDAVSGVGEIENNGAVVKVENGKILVQGEIGSDVRIFTADGSLIDHFTQHNEIEVSNVARGIYVVAVGDHTAKVIVP